MKKIFCLVLILIVFGFRGFSQITYTPMIASGYQIKYLKTDSGFALPLRDTTIGRGINRAGALVVRAADNLPYYYNGTNWVLLGTSGGLVPDVTLQDAFDNDPTALPKINAHNQSFNVDSSIGVTLSSRSNSISGKIGQIALSAGTFSLQNSTPQVGGTFGSTVSSADSLLVGLAKNNANETRFRLSPSDFLVSRLGGSYKSIGTSINGDLFDETGNIELNLSGQRFGIEDNMGVQDRSVNMNHKNLVIDSVQNVFIGQGTTADDEHKGLFVNDDAVSIQNINSSGSAVSYFMAQNQLAQMWSDDGLGGIGHITHIDVTPEAAKVYSNGLGLGKNIIRSINGLEANDTGNITIAAAGGTVTNVTGTAPVIITGTSTVTPNVTVDTSKAGGRLATYSDNILKQNLVTLTTTGTSGASTFNQGTGALNIPNYSSTITPAALTKTDDANVTLTLGGTPTTALLQATSLTLGWTGALSIARGGTNNGSLSVANGTTYYGDGTKLLGLAPGTNGQHLVLKAGIPFWGDTTAVGAGGVTGTGLQYQVTYWDPTNTIKGHTGLTFNPAPALASNLSRSLILAPTMPAFTANTDTVIALDISPTYNIGSFNGSRIALRALGGAITNSNDYTNNSALAGNAGLNIVEPSSTNILANGNIGLFKTLQTSTGGVVVQMVTGSSKAPLQLYVGSTSMFNVSNAGVVTAASNINAGGSISAGSQSSVIAHSGGMVFTTSGASNFMKGFQTTGDLVIGGTPTDVIGSKFTVTETTKGSLPSPRLTTVQRDAILVTYPNGGVIVGGTGYVNGSYTTVPLTGGSGTGATASITVTATAVSIVTTNIIGTGYRIGDVLSASNANLGGSGSGFTYTVNLLGSSTAPATGLQAFNTNTGSQEIFNGDTWNPLATWSYKAVTGTYTAASYDYTLDATSGTFTITLPTAVGIRGRVYIISNSGAGTITVGTTSSQTFANVVATPTTLSMATVGARTVQSNGANWLLLSSL